MTYERTYGKIVKALRDANKPIPDSQRFDKKHSDVLHSVNPYVAAFWELHTDRQVVGTMSGILQLPIPHSAIREYLVWMGVGGTEEQAAHIRVIRALDDAFLRHATSMREMQKTSESIRVKPRASKTPISMRRRR